MTKRNYKMRNIYCERYLWGDRPWQLNKWTVRVEWWIIKARLPSFKMQHRFTVGRAGKCYHFIVWSAMWIMSNIMERKLLLVLLLTLAQPARLKKLSVDFYTAWQFLQYGHTMLLYRWYVVPTDFKNHKLILSAWDDTWSNRFSESD